MSFLRLAVMCAVFDDDRRILLSKRGDLNIWNLPGGRLDSGESLARAAAREVGEETGVAAHIERAVGLYYSAGWRRMNILFAGFPLGGELLSYTSEARANHYFSLEDLPENTLRTFLIDDALADCQPLPRIVSSPSSELRRVKWKLRWRWVKNLLRGQPEPRHVRFDVQAVALVWDEAHHRLLTLPGVRARVLPRVVCDGDDAPWEQLAGALKPYCAANVALQWVGLWHNAVGDSLEFVFAAAVPETTLSGGAEWSSVQSAALMGLDADYAGLVKATYDKDDIWTISYIPEREPLGEIMIGEKMS